MAKLYLDGIDIDVSQFVSPEEVEELEKAKLMLENPTALKSYYDYFEEKVAYDKIRFGLAILEKQKR